MNLNIKKIFILNVYWLSITASAQDLGRFNCPLIAVHSIEEAAAEITDTDFKIFVESLVSLQDKKGIRLIPRNYKLHKMNTRGFKASQNGAYEDYRIAFHPKDGQLLKDSKALDINRLYALMHAFGHRYHYHEINNVNAELQADTFAGKAIAVLANNLFTNEQRRNLWNNIKKSMYSYSVENLDVEHRVRAAQASFYKEIQLPPPPIIPSPQTAPNPPVAPSQPTAPNPPVEPSQPTAPNPPVEPSQPTAPNPPVEETKPTHPETTPKNKPIVIKQHKWSKGALSFSGGYSYLVNAMSSTAFYDRFAPQPQWQPVGFSQAAGWHAAAQMDWHWTHWLGGGLSVNYAQHWASETALESNIKTYFNLQKINYQSIESVSDPYNNWLLSSVHLTLGWFEKGATWGFKLQPFLGYPYLFSNQQWKGTITYSDATPTQTFEIYPSQLIGNWLWGGKMEILLQGKHVALGVYAQYQDNDQLNQNAENQSFSNLWQLQTLRFQQWQLGGSLHLGF